MELEIIYFTCKSFVTMKHLYWHFWSNECIFAE